MFKEILNVNPSKNSPLQIDCKNQLEKIFVKENIEKIEIDNYSFLGVRGKYIDKENYCLNYKFNYNGFTFEFFIMYDQFEYHIEQNSITLKKCNLEDFDESSMINDFIEHLKRDLKKLNIEFSGN